MCDEMNDCVTHKKLKNCNSLQWKDDQAQLPSQSELGNPIPLVETKGSQTNKMLIWSENLDDKKKKKTQTHTHMHRHI